MTSSPQSISSLCPQMPIGQQSWGGGGQGYAPVWDQQSYQQQQHQQQQQQQHQQVCLMHACPPMKHDHET